MEKEAIVVCSDRNLGTGITIWDLETGDHLLHIPTCASPPHGLLILRNQFLVASQVQKQGCVGGGAIFIWPLNKPQSPLRNYLMEAIGPLCCTKDGLYLAGGTPSGNICVWEVSSGRMMKYWQAHKNSISCITFSSDMSFLISGSNAGEICVWPTLSLLDIVDCESAPSFLHYWLEHRSSITCLLTLEGSSYVISSSLDGTFKTWNLVSGKLVRAQGFSQGITTITLDPEEQKLFLGSVDGKIFVHALDIAINEDSVIVQGNEYFMVLNEHMVSITALSFSISGLFLISASEDGVACLWDVNSGNLIRKYNHHKGRISNITVIPQQQLFTRKETQHKLSFQLRVVPLDKYPRPEDISKGTIILSPTFYSLDDQRNTYFITTCVMHQQITDLERRQTPEAIQMNVDTNLEKRIWATNMAKDITEINKHLRSRLLDLVQFRLSCELDYTTIENQKSFRVSKVSSYGEDYRRCSS